MIARKGPISFTAPLPVPHALWLAILLILWLTAGLAAAQASNTIRIGVLAKRGSEITLSRWSATADYLSERIPAYRFVITPLDFQQISNAVVAGNIDFVLANPAIYVTFEKQYGISRIATLKNLIGGNSYSQFGGVIFARADLAGFSTLADIRDRHLSAVDKTSLGGFQMAWREMLHAGIDPYRDTASLDFAGTHDAVVYAVLRGDADIGTVRTDTLERMALENKIQLADIQVLPHGGEEHVFDLLHSTRLYPEWPIARLRHTPQALAESVAQALLSMPADSRAATASHSAGWTIPMNYQAIHQLLADLQLPPYEPKPISITEFILQHWLLVSLVAGGFIVTSAFSIALSRKNLILTETGKKLQLARDQLELRVEERTRELLDKEKELEILIENIPSAVFVKQADDLRYVLCNQAAEELFGYSRSEIIGQCNEDFLPADEARRLTDSDHHILQNGCQMDREEHRLHTPAGLRYVQTRKVCIPDTRGNPKYLLGIVHDITDHKLAREKLARLATHDPLTDLYNRRVFEQRLNEAVLRAQRYDEAVSLLMLDLDHFKQINDSHGHRAGDEILRRVAHVILKQIRGTDLAARYGGEEFAVILSGTSESQADEMSERIRQHIQALEIKIDSDTCASTTISIGISEYSPQLASSEALIEAADQALYRAKQEGRNCVVCAD